MFCKEWQIYKCWLWRQLMHLSCWLNFQPELYSHSISQQFEKWKLFSVWTLFIPASSKTKTPNWMSLISFPTLFLQSLQFSETKGSKTAGFGTLFVSENWDALKKQSEKKSNSVFSGETISLKRNAFLWITRVHARFCCRKLSNKWRACWRIRKKVSDFSNCWEIEGVKFRLKV